MSITIELTPEQTAQLQSEAARLGISPEELATRRVVEAVDSASAAEDEVDQEMIREGLESIRQNKSLLERLA